MHNPLRIRKKSDIWMLALGVSVISVLISELCIGVVYLVGGPAYFHMQAAIVFAAVVPIIISVPISLAIGTMSFKLISTQTELKRLADEDPLTQLPNRRSFFATAQTHLEGLESNGGTSALLVIDADHFKQLNDSYGHAVGDRALVGIAEVLRENFRESDLICRVGGEEFAVLLPEMSISEAQPLATRVVEAVAANPLSEPGAVIEYSVSCGVADTTTSYNLQALFKAADDAMYLAKRQGRNRVALIHDAAA